MEPLKAPLIVIATRASQARNKDPRKHESHLGPGCAPERRRGGRRAAGGAGRGRRRTRPCVLASRRRCHRSAPGTFAREAAAGWRGRPSPAARSSAERSTSAQGATEGRRGVRRVPRAGGYADAWAIRRYKAYGDTYTAIRRMRGRYDGSERFESDELHASQSCIWAY